MKGKRILSAVLSAALLLQLSPLAAFAEDTSLLPVTAQTALTEPAPEEPTPEPAGEETALPEELAPEETAVPMAAPTPEPTAEPTTTPAAEESAPDAAETPAPEPSAEPTAAPDPAAEVQAMIDALPDEVTEDNAEAVEQALTDIDDAKESLTDEELAGLDFARYDAAANALLALWGEVATDEVELLDANAAPSQDPTDNYYLIDSVEDLYWFANEVNNNARTTINARLTADIKLNGENKVLNDDGSLTSNADNLEKWKPIGTDDTGKRFTGIFDGNNKTISGLYYNNSETSYVGLFGCVGKGGTVKNVNVTDSYVSGKNSVGGICGYNNGGTLQNCHNTGKVSGNSKVGGVCGRNNEGTLYKSYNEGEVTGTMIVGGVCGENYHNSDSSNNSTVNECYNTGNVTGTSNYVGGVCGNNYGGTVQGCYNTKAVKGSSTVGGVCGQNARNGTVEGCHNEGNVTGTADDGQQVGGVCGYIESGTVKECHNDGTVTGTMIVGGVCGQNGTNGTLQKCYNTNTVSGTNYVGGVCGTQVKGTVQECYNTGKVTGAITGEFGCIGGVCGWNSNGILEKSYNTHTVSGTKFVGGVCGKNNNTVNGCYNTGTVTGTGESIGGVCGQNKNTVNGCYNTGDVSGKGSKVGGVCGDNYHVSDSSNNSTVNGCYNTGNVTGTEYVGGVCGENTGKVENCYYLAGTSANAVGNGTDGTNCASKTKLQFQNGAVAYQLQSDLGETETQVWGQTLGKNASPVLAWQTEDCKQVYHPTSGTHPCKGGYNNTGDGTLAHKYENSACIYCGEPEPPNFEGGYYQITNEAQLYWFADQVSNKGQTNINAKLTADITLNSNVLNENGELNTGANFTPWTPIGTNTNPFTGTFDGNNKTISGLYFNDSGKDDVGLFGCVGEHGKVINVTLADSYVSGKSTVGGICGWNDGGTLQNCHNAGTVSGAYFVGGVCGINNNSGTIQKCDNAGTVSGTNSKVGGVCGSNGNGTGSSSTTIQECYNTGKVSGKSWVGGVCGQNTGGTLEKSYNTNTVTGTGNYIGGVCGDNYNSGTVKECYSYSTVRNVCGDNSGIVENCYYLSTKSGTAHRNGGISKTEAEFNSGEVAYLLQNKREQAVWGQKIGTDDYPKLGGDKVYQSAPCPTNYSNTSTHKDHNIGADGKCTACGTQCIAYTVTIPATVQLGTTATIKAKDVILPNGKTLNVKVAEGSEFKVALDGNPALDTCEYTVTDVTNKTATKEVTPLVPVLTAVSGESEKTVELQFNKPESTTYSGTYTGTVTFTVSVDNKS